MLTSHAPLPSKEHVDTICTHLGDTTARRRVALPRRRRRRSHRGSHAVIANKISVERRDEERRYVLLVDGEQAGELVFRDRGDAVLAFLHTEVDPVRQQRGLGSALVKGALDDARAQGFKVVAMCPFVEAYVHDHPGYADLAVSDPARRRSF